MRTPGARAGTGGGGPDLPGDDLGVALGDGTGLAGGDPGGAGSGLDDPSGSGTGGGGEVGGGGGGGGGAAGGAQPCAAPSDEVGVTDATITVGTITTLSGPAPGLGESSGAAVRAYVAQLNANGGVCGRQVELITGDDGMDNGRYRSLLQQQAPRVLGLIGGVAGGDAGGVDIARSAGLPMVSNPISPNMFALPNVFGVKPPYAQPDASIGKYRWLASQGVTKAAIVYTALDQTRAEYENFHRRQIEAAGITVVLKKELPLATLNYDATAREIEASGAQYLMMQGETTMTSGMARSIQRYGLPFPEYLPGYSQDFIRVAGAAAEGSVAFLRSLPNEEAGSNAEQSRFLDWMARAAPGSPADAFAADAWAASKAFFDALQALPGPITRAAVVDSIASIREFDADGFIGPIDLGGKASQGCVIGVVVRNGQWTRLVPDSGFLC